MKENQEKDKIGTKPDQIEIKREAWKSLAMSKSSHNQESRKREENTNLRDQIWKTLKDKEFAPTAVLTKSGIVSISTARQISSRAAALVSAAKPINTAASKPLVNIAKPRQNALQKSHSLSRRPFYQQTTLKNRNLNNKVNTAKGDPQDALKDQGYLDSGCFRHMTGNISYLTDFKKHDRGYVAFGGGAKGGKITANGIIKTDKLDFEDVYFVKELQFNLFSVSQMCDKKNSVLFTDIECFVVSPNYKLADKSQVLLKVPRKNNMYSFDMKNIVPQKDLTCLLAKATNNKSMLWHRRLGHINFKNINKLVKDNLVRGLPPKHFENNQTCVACLKRKQHKVSFKSKLQNSLSQPLFMLHMDLFGPTSVSTIVHKKYCLVIIDDFSRFTWVFFLATKDETSRILKSFITEIENLVEKKQNGVVERRNKTLIEAARTMLANSKLPTTFWAEAVNTACYVQNRVLVVKPHFKTPYELFKGRSSALSFMRPFGCHVTILNTLDQLGKFDGKLDEGVFIGYSTISKAFRVYNTRTRKVEENVHITFLENKPMIACGGPDWLFDIDSLSKLINYAPVLADEGAKADYNNLETVISVSPISSTRIYKDHPKEQIIGKVNSAVQTRKLAKQNEADGTKEGCNISQFQGHRQEKGIDYDEVFAPVARIEAIRLFLASASFMDFTVYQMDVKSAFLYGTIEEEVYVSQPLGFVDLEFPDIVPDIMFDVCACSRFQVQPKVSHIHAVKRIFRYLKGQPTLGLWYPKDSPLELIAYSDSDYAGASLDRNLQQEVVLWIQNQLLDYRYNFMQTKIHVDNESAICVVKNPVYHSNTKHIEIRHHFIRDSYEKRLIKMVKIHIYYNVADLLTKAFDVTTFQFLIASIDKKELAILGQTVTGKEFSNPLMAGSLPKTISAKVSAASTNLILLVTVNTFRDQHNMVAYLEKSDDNIEFYQIGDFFSSCSINYALTVSPIIYASYIEQFWNTASSKTVNSVKQIHAIVDGKDVVISESSVRNDILFDDEDDEVVYQEEGDRVERLSLLMLA
nr:hypothetical protein [Tanacetum cinerariifolium]